MNGELVALFGALIDAVRDRGLISALVASLERPGAPVTEVLGDWLERTGHRIARARQALEALAGHPDFTAFFVASAQRALRDLENAAKEVGAAVEQQRRTGLPPQRDFT